MNFDVKVSNHEFSLSTSKDQVLVQGVPIDFEIIEIRAHEWLVYIGNRCHTIVRKQELTGDTYVVNGTEVTLSVKTDLDKILEKLGMDIEAGTQISEVVAPMPGAILEICVTVGQEVKAGDKLVILEAMKMENVIKSPTDGVIAAIKIDAGTNVEKGKSMILFS
ncbi:MAG: biotin carboxyl carrier protein [Cyclobacteriaceae bacterium]|jgi:biotin carboxyl carrier protein